MNKIFASALVAATLAVSSPAMAALTGGTSTAATPFQIVVGPPGSTTQSGGDSVNAFTPGAFTDYFEFVVPSAGVVGAQAGTVTVSSAAGIVFKFLTLNGMTTNTVSSSAPGSFQIALNDVATTANPQKFSVGYDVQKAGTYTASVSWTQAAAVPEPATWALMILGFGVVGYAMRRRPSVRFAQAI